MSPNAHEVTSTIDDVNITMKAVTKPSPVGSPLRSAALAERIAQPTRPLRKAVR